LGADRLGHAQKRTLCDTGDINVMLQVGDMDPQATASGLIEEYGSDAIGKVLLRVFETQVLADVRAEGVWLTVLGAVINLQMLQRASERVLH
jgi:hypothetical protein